MLALFGFQYDQGLINFDGVAFLTRIRSLLALLFRARSGTLTGLNPNFACGLFLAGSWLIPAFSAFGRFFRGLFGSAFSALLSAFCLSLPQRFVSSGTQLDQVIGLPSRLSPILDPLMALMTPALGRDSMTRLLSDSSVTSSVQASTLVGRPCQYLD